MRAVLLFLYMLFSGMAVAQLNGKYNFNNLDQSDGLLHSNIFGIGQDQQGFIWVLSLNGLQRFDGTRFVNYPEVVYHTIPGQLGNSDLFVDTLQDRIQIGKTTRIQFFDPSSRKIETQLAVDYLQQHHNPQQDIYATDDDDRWLMTEDGFARFPKETNEPDVAYFNGWVGQQNQSKFLVRDTITGWLWTHSFGSILYGDPEDHRIHLGFTIDKNPSGLGARYLFLDHQRNLWVSTWSKYFYKYNLDNHSLKKYSLEEIKIKAKLQTEKDQVYLINAFMEDRQHQLWMATDNAGLLRYDHDHDDFDVMTSDDRLVNGLHYAFQTKCLYQDREDNIWVGTDRGISVFNPYHPQIRVIRHQEGNLHSLPYNDINDIIQSKDGQILVATWGGGITVFDEEWNFIRQIRFPGPEQLNQVWSLVAMKDGTIWAGTQRGYIHHLDPVRQSFTTHHPPEMEESTIRCMVSDTVGNIYIGLNNGKVIFWEHATETFFALAPNSAEKDHGLSIINDIFIDHSQRCWVSTEEDLKEYDDQHHQYIATYNFGIASDSTQEKYTLMGIDELDDSTLIVGSFYGGLFLFHKNTGAISQYASCENAGQLSIAAVRKDDHHSIWFTSSDGLFEIDRVSGNYSRVETGNLAIHDAFHSCRFYPLQDGRWVTSTGAEIICFHPDLISSKAIHQHRIEICGMKVRGNDLAIDALLKENHAIQLNYRQNFITIDYADLQFDDLLETSYSYRLDGLDEEWIQAGTKRFAEYTDLKPGAYVFQVKAQSGSQTYPVNSFSLTITPPWWGTLAFRLFFFLAIGCSVYALIRNKMQAIRKQAQWKQQIAETEMMALRSQMNPHFIFNCINSIDAMIQHDDKYKATMYLNKFARLIRNVLDSSREKTVPLSRDLETLQLYVDLEMFRNPGKFKASLEADPELLHGDYKVPPLIIQPYVENAILHGLKARHDQLGQLQIRVTKTSSHLVYTIEDNGVGRSNMTGIPSSNAKGFGMQMTSDRIRLFNQENVASVDITDLHTDGQPSGTRVEVKLILQQT